jgi:hypothetical protein
MSCNKDIIIYQWKKTILPFSAKVGDVAQQFNWYTVQLLIADIWYSDRDNNSWTGVKIFKEVIVTSNQTVVPFGLTEIETNNLPIDTYKRRVKRFKTIDDWSEPLRTPLYNLNVQP